jgi:CRP-like cAMP-binding protein/tRNA A-37 threonylcarbamoyl transferase component Bud32
MSAELPRNIGKYQVIRELGRGATSVVYLARDPFSDREVAVKLGNPEALNDPVEGRRYRRLFLNEASLAGKLFHPNIVNVLDAVVEDNCSYIVMEYVRGETLNKYCGRDNLLPIEKAVGIIYKCCMALDFAHKSGVIHRDIKPANILLTPEDDVKITDFGTAQFSFSQQTQLAGLLGSPAYMSPEQIMEQPLTTQTDIYSLGVVLYVLLTGRHLYEAKTYHGMIYRILNEQPRAVTEHRPEVPPRLEQIVRRAIEKDLSRRYKSWVEFARDLTETFTYLERFKDDISDREKFSAFRNLRFFRDFRDEELWEVVRIALWKRYPANKRVMLEGHFGHSFFIIAQGEVRVTKGGKFIHTLRAGDCFGETSWLSKVSARRTTTITSASEVVLIKIRGPLLEQLSEHCQLRFYRIFLQTLVERLSWTETCLLADETAAGRKRREKRDEEPGTGREGDPPPEEREKIRHQR